MSRTFPNEFTCDNFANIPIHIIQEAFKSCHEEETAMLSKLGELVSRSTIQLVQTKIDNIRAFELSINCFKKEMLINSVSGKMELDTAKILLRLINDGIAPSFVTDAIDVELIKIWIDATA